MPWDYVLFQYRRQMGLTWPEVKATPTWRIRQDLTYMTIERETPKGNQG